MKKFSNATFGIIICGILATFYYIFGVLFFFCQGELIDSIINKHSTGVWLTILFVIAIKIAMLLSDVFLQNIKEYLSIIYYKNEMLRIYPSKVYNDFKDKSSYIFDTLHDNLYSIYLHRLNIIVNRISFFIVFSVYVLILMHSQFLLGGITVLFLGIVVFLSRHVYDNQLEKTLEQVSARKKSLTIWSKEYFDGYKEISTIWLKRLSGKRWFDKLLSPYINYRIKSVKYLFLKDLLSQVFIETPFVLLMCLVLLGVYYGKITIPQAFIWLGVSQFVLNVSKELARNPTLKKFEMNCSRRINEIERIVAEKPGELIPDLKRIKFSQVTFSLKNNKKVSLSTKPGIYSIDGENGTGKTTLLDTMSGFCRNSPYDTLSMDILKSSLGIDSIRLIDVNSIVFTSLDTFDLQLIGFSDKVGFVDCNIERKISRSLKPYLPENLISQWLLQMQHLRIKFDANENYILSLGEHVILSCLRNWVCWNSQIKLLLIDECDSCLDKNNRSLFYQTIDRLSQKIAIYVISHSSVHEQALSIQKTAKAS